MDYSHFDSIDFDSLLDDLSGDYDYTSTEDYESSSVSSDTVVTVSKNSFRKSYYTPDNDVQPLKKKLDFIPRVVRIVRSDIRRAYPAMLANVWNSLDFHMIYGFMDTYFQRNFEQKSNKIHPSTNTSYSKSLFGVETVSKIFYTNAVLQPDSVFILGETNVFKSTDTSQNRIVSTFRMEATRIFDVPDLEKLFKLASTHTPPDEKDTVGTKRKNNYSKQFIMNDIMQSVHDITEDLQLLAVPEKVEYEGSVTMFTDENDRVSSMVMSMRAVEREGPFSMCPDNVSSAEISCR